MFIFSGMLAVVFDDFTVVIVDLEARRIVRRFTGHSSSVTDLVGGKKAPLREHFETAPYGSAEGWNLPFAALQNRVRVCLEPSALEVNMNICDDYCT